MSSTSSSAEQTAPKRSATEVLASRYRHLFVLPSTPRLLLYAGIASSFLCILSRWASGVVSFVPAFVVFILSAAAISSALRIIDKKTIATFRRAHALLLAGEVVWLLVTALGAVYAWFSRSPYPLTNALLFGAFLSAGLEFLVINGTFEKNVSVSLILAVLHPASTLAIVRLQELTVHFDLVAAISGALALALICAFPILLRRRKTSRGHDSLSLFKAFMKTWTAGDSAELEEIIADHSEEVDVTTKVLRFRTSAGDTFLVLPGVHPGPFHPVGSYDLPGVISRTFKELGPVMTFHRPGGHERNLATREETTKYAMQVVELAHSITPVIERALVRGPVHARIGKANVTASAFAADMIMTISFAPLGSDDLEGKVELELDKPALEAGFELSIIDGHNSIDRDQHAVVIDDPGWKRIFETTNAARADHFSVAFSHSSELGFSGRGDLTENGIGLFMLQTSNAKSVLILADANNSVPTLRAKVAEALASSGYDLIEFCTSDSHNLAARGSTVSRGYEALGEVTPPDSIAELVLRMAKLAETRLATAAYGSGQMKSRVRIFGSKALEEFAGITQSSSKFSKAYLRFAVVAVTALLLASIFF